MADTKRQNVGGKAQVATQNAGPVSMESALSGAIGARARLTTSSQTNLEGSIFTVCPFTNLVAIATNPPNPVHHILPISSIQSFSIIPPSPVSAPESFTAASPPLSPVSPATLLNRANAAVARLHELAARKNRSVSKDAQDIFDAVSRTLPTRWDGTSIVVMDAVVIASPYRAEDCRAGSANALAQVKKVLENERKRLADRSNKVVPAVPAMPIGLAGGLRKGG